MKLRTPTSMFVLYVVWLLLALFLLKGFVIGNLLPNLNVFQWLIFFKGLLSISVLLRSTLLIFLNVSSSTILLLLSWSNLNVWSLRIVVTWSPLLKISLALRNDFLVYSIIFSPLFKIPLTWLLVRFFHNHIFGTLRSPPLLLRYLIVPSCSWDDTFSSLYLEGSGVRFIIYIIREVS